MKSYECVRKCYAYGKKWKVGEKMEASVVPNHHFVEIDGDNHVSGPALVPMQLKAPTRDVMKPLVNTTQATSFSEMQGTGSPIKHGMAAGLGDNGAINNPKEMVTR